MFQTARQSEMEPTRHLTWLRSPVGQAFRPPHGTIEPIIFSCHPRSHSMPRIVRGGLIQATLCEPATSPAEKIKQAMIEKHETLIAQVADRGAQIICLQELFYGPYF